MDCAIDILINQKSTMPKTVLFNFLVTFISVMGLFQNLGVKSKLLLCVESKGGIKAVVNYILLMRVIDPENQIREIDSFEWIF